MSAAGAAPLDLTAELGALRAEYRVGRASIWLMLFSCLVLGGFGMICLLGPWLFFPDPRAGLGTDLFVSALGALLLLLCGAVVVKVLPSRRRTLLLYERGIAERSGARVRVFRWSDVLSLRCGRAEVHGAAAIAIGRIERYVLKDRGGETLLVDQGFANVAQLGAELEGEITRQLLPVLRRQLTGGQTVEFGKIALTPEGVRSGRRTLAWCDLAGADSDFYVVRFFQQGEGPAWAKVSCDSLTNIRVLLALISERTAAR